MIAIKASVLVKGLRWSALLVYLGLAAINTATQSIALANSTVSQKGDTVKVPSFDVNVTLTDKAKRKLKASKETIVVFVSASGEPNKNSSVKLNEVGSVDLFSSQIGLPQTGKAQFRNLSVSASKLNQLVSPDYNVNVNVFSGRHSSQDNLLSCDFFDGEISKIQPSITLKCGLIGEYSSQYINSSSNPIRKNLSQPTVVPTR